MESLYTLPTALRAELKPPMAPVRTTEEALPEVAGRFLVVVGDVSAEHFLEAGVTPDVIVADWFTQRGAVPAAGATGIGVDALKALHARALAGEGGRVIQVENPAAHITRALWDALESAIRDGPAPTLVEVVDGEEDLAVLPALVLAPEGARVAYGQPNEGVVVVPVTDATRARAESLLARMRVTGPTSHSSDQGD